MNPPTLAQLKKRPALWWSGNEDDTIGDIYITYPDRSVYFGKDMITIEDPALNWQKMALKHFEFMGWL